MKSLYQFITESSTRSRDLSKYDYSYLRSFLIRMIQEPENIKIGPQGATELGEVDPEAALELASSVIKELTEKDVSGEDDIIEYLNNVENFKNIDISLDSTELGKIIKEINDRDGENRLGGLEKWTGIYKQSISKGQFEASCEDMEYFIALSANKNLEFTGEYQIYNKYKEDDFKMMLVVFGVDPDKFDPDHSEKNRNITSRINRILEYYNNKDGEHYKEQIDKSASKLIELYGDISSPLFKASSNKGDLPDELQKRIEEDNLKINATSKTDLQTKDEKYTISFKKLPDSQIASGSPTENMLAFEYALKECEKNISTKDVAKIKNKYKEIQSTTDNRKLSTLYNDLLHLNPLFTKNFIYAHITGEHKFKDGSNAAASSLFAFDLNDPEKCENISPEVLAAYYTEGIMKGVVSVASTKKGDLQNALRIPLQMNKLENSKEPGSLSKFVEKSKSSIMNDDEYEDDTSEETKDIEGKTETNPSKIWRRRKNKRTGDLTKSYYNKEGNSITGSDFKRMMNKYLDKNK